MSPLAALGDASPSPSLDSVLAAVPSEYTAPVHGPFEGHITVNGFASTWGPDAARGANELGLDGFVDGYGVMRSDATSGRFVVEFVLAFSGRSGALRFLGSDNAENRADAGYQHSDSMSGVGPYYDGVHGTTASPPMYLDAFEFVKGNDLFGVAFYSPRDDVLAFATEQARAQYAAAPEQTIPSSQWPENRSVDTGGGFGVSDGQLLFGIVVIGLLAAGAVFVLMRKSELRPATPAASREMTSDRKFWWNGTYWVATSEMAPPWAQRSPDGAFWWDGHAWQQMPLASPPLAR
jgi:hypothetical protein